VAGGLVQRLNIGSGNRHLPGYVSVDVRPLAGVGLVCDARRLAEHVPAASVQAIYCRHFLEHLTAAEAVAALADWREILQPGGTLELVVPDLAYHAQQLLFRATAPSALSPRVTRLQHAVAGFYGWQAHAHDLHQYGYVWRTLVAALQGAGYVDIARVHDDPWHLHAKARRRDGG